MQQDCFIPQHDTQNRLANDVRRNRLAWFFFDYGIYIQTNWTFVLKTTSWKQNRHQLCKLICIPANPFLRSSGKVPMANTHMLSHEMMIDVDWIFKGFRKWITPNVKQSSPF